MTIGEKIKKYRLEEGLTQKQLAENANISEISVRKYEADDRMPKIDTLSKIARTLNVSIDDLDSGYTYMLHDREDTSKLVIQLENFMEELQKMDISEENKQKNLNKAKDLIGDSEKLINLIDTTMSRDKEMKDTLDETRTLKKEIQEMEQDIDEMCLSVLHRLNNEGLNRVLAYAVDLSRIPEYRSETEIQTEDE